MTMLHDIPPAAILIAAALLVPLFRGSARNWFVILLPAFCFYWVWSAQPGNSLQVPFLGFELTLLRVDRLSKAFGYIFTLNAFAAFIYAYYLKNSAHHVSALMYIGSSLGVVFAGDLITLYLFWEMMAITSTFLILARNTKRSMKAGTRYVLVHIAGGLVLLAGILITISISGSTAFEPAMFKDPHTGAWLILIGLLVNAAAPPLAAWLPDAYPEATVTGGVILSAYTSKTAVYTLIRGFPGWEILIVLGCIMTIYGIIYALLENDMRRILAYSIINQVGFMVCGVGIGSELSLNGTVAHAFCHIIYKALLWMSAGAVLHRTLMSKCTQLGGLHKTMPWTLVFGAIGALAISAVPGTSGFTSKSLIIDGAAEAHLFWPWLVLEIASAGVFLHAGIKFPYFVFFAKDRGLRPKEANRSMRLAMGFLAFLCIFLGVYPKPLYAILPHQEMFRDGHFTVFSAAHLITQTQLLIFSGLVFFLFLPLLKRTDTISLDTDWFYRKGGALFYRTMDKGLNSINDWAYRLFVGRLTRQLVHFFIRGPTRLFVLIQIPFWKELDQKARFRKIRFCYRRAMLGTAPIGMTAFMAVLLLLVLFFIAIGSLPI